MNQANRMPPEKQPPTLGNTLFMSGLCIVMGGVVFLIGIGVIPSGGADPSAGARLLAVGAGLLFVFAGIMILLRDFGGARNGGDFPQTAPALLRLGEKALTIILIAIFALICTIIAFGTFFAGGVGATVFRVIMGVFALVFWYAAIYLLYDKFRKRVAGQK